MFPHVPRSGHRTHRTMYRHGRSGWKSELSGCTAPSRSIALPTTRRQYTDQTTRGAATPDRRCIVNGPQRSVRTSRKDPPLGGGCASLGRTHAGQTAWLKCMTLPLTLPAISSSISYGSICELKRACVSMSDSRLPPPIRWSSAIPAADHRSSPQIDSKCDACTAGRRSVPLS